MNVNASVLADLQPYQTDVLFLLVGTNPLPNYVAAVLLTAPRAKVFLLHTSTTLSLAQAIRDQLGTVRGDLEVIPYEIDATDGALIEDKVASVAGSVRRDSRMGLNYTGGTKPMAVHATHALRRAFPDGVFSYLDASELALVFQGTGRQARACFVGQALDVPLDTILALHGITSWQSRAPIFPATLSQAIVQVHLAHDGFGQWRDWLSTFGDRRRPPELPDASNYPALAPANAQFEALCGATATPEGVARRLGFENGQLRSAAKALTSEWLEDYVASALEPLQAELGITVHVGVILRRPGADPQELDVLVMSGYQLFAISCMVTTEKGPAKGHLMEAFVRARQLGGDEARFALISLYRDPARLEREISQTWDTEDKVRVFGPPHMADLSGYLEAWIKTASRI